MSDSSACALKVVAHSCSIYFFFFFTLLTSFPQFYIPNRSNENSACMKNVCQLLSHFPSFTSSLISPCSGLWVDMVTEFNCQAALIAADSSFFLSAHVNDWAVPHSQEIHFLRIPQPWQSSSNLLSLCYLIIVPSNYSWHKCVHCGGTGHQIILEERNQICGTALET